MRRRWITGWKSCEKDWGWSSKILIFCKYGDPRFTTPSRQKKRVKVDNVKTVVGTVVSNVEPVLSTVAKEVKETDEPGGAKVKLELVMLLMIC